MSLPDYQKLYDLVSDGISDRDIGRLYEVSEHAIRGLRIRFGIPNMLEMRRRNLAKIEASFPLSWPPLKEHVVWWLSQGLRDKEIAQRYRVSTESIRKLRNRMSLTAEGLESDAPPNHKARPKIVFEIPAGFAYEDVSEEVLEAESESVAFRRDYRSRVVPRNYAECNDPAYRRLVLA